jgi:hypothetical protein
LTDRALAATTFRNLRYANPPARHSPCPTKALQIQDLIAARFFLKNSNCADRRFLSSALHGTSLAKRSNEFPENGFAQPRLQRVHFFSPTISRRRRLAVFLLRRAFFGRCRKRSISAKSAS